MALLYKQLEAEPSLAIINTIKTGLKNSQEKWY
jgi:hypothetical protein